jgi:16S rRNA (guanine(966)-N(2))-methyltransferase RsmD
MRIIGGRLRRRQLLSPAGRDVRPTSDRLRETLFNVLGAGVEGARVLDAFAGTGALGLEALSRGAREVVFVEPGPDARAVVVANVHRCGAEAACRVVAGRFPGPRVPPGPYDLVLLDPPYDVADLGGLVAAAADVLAPDGRVVLEHSRRRSPPDAAGRLARARLLEAGDSALSFYRPAAGEPREPHD